MGRRFFAQERTFLFSRRHWIFTEEVSGGKIQFIVKAAREFCHMQPLGLSYWTPPAAAVQIFTNFSLLFWRSCLSLKQFQGIASLAKLFKSFCWRWIMQFKFTLVFVECVFFCWRKERWNCVFWKWPAKEEPRQKVRKNELGRNQVIWGAFENWQNSWSWANILSERKWLAWVTRRMKPPTAP